MAFKNVAIGWLSGGVLLLGYAGYAWVRGTRAGSSRPTNLDRSAPEPTHGDVEPLSERLERVPEELALGGDYGTEPEPANGNAPGQRSDLGALFLARAAGALSGVDFPSPQRSHASQVPR